jgi:TatD DNase family protein
MTSGALPLTDTHCHLNLDDFADDLDSVILRARQSGVGRILIPGIDLETSKKALDIATRNADVFAAVGIHPHNATSWSDRSREVLRELAANPKVVAIGEIGLDFYRDLSPRVQQIKAFQEQLDLAQELGLPVVIHNREAIESILEITIPWASNTPVHPHPGVMHAFSADTGSAQEAIERGFLIGIAGPITYLNAEDRRSITSQLPIEHLLIETDSPYLTPHPDRGKRNEPAKVGLIAEGIAEVFDLDLPTVAEYTTSNASRLFNWSDERENG